MILLQILSFNFARHSRVCVLGPRRWFRAVLLCLFLPVVSYAQAKFNFNIQSQRADEALTQFAKQANTTLIFPYDLAEKETSNTLVGEYSIELGIIKLLEGTGLYPVADEDGRISIRPIARAAGSEKNQPTVAVTPDKVKPEIRPFALEKIAIVGTRASPRSVIESPVPVDIIDSDDFRRQGATDIMSMLSALIPSFNVNDQPINDASTLVRPANLRGMASDHTLVLLNGKRRHRSSVITFLGGGLSDGAQGPDISTIPSSALRQVEVLRDGAAAQYGSDAIAGVLNFVLSDEREGGTFEARAGQYFEGDGELIQVQGNRGFGLWDTGFVNMSFEYRQQKATDRSVQRTDAAQLIRAGNGFIANPSQIWGSPELDFDIKTSVNAGADINTEIEWYGFATGARRKVEGGFYFRNPHTRDGVNGGGVNELGVPLLLVGDLDGLEQGVDCPQVTIEDDNVLDDADYLLIADNGTDVGRNCFAFNELLPGGFRPLFGGRITDAALVSGIRGELGDEWVFDLSVGMGYSKIEYLIRNTINPSLGPSSPTDFAPGTASQRERSANLDIAKQWDMPWGERLNLGVGMEWRREQFRQTAGDVASYTIGPLAQEPDTGLFQGFGVGSNGFPGYRPESAGLWSRGNWATYLDIESDVNDTLMLGVALRYEDFTDFGDTFDGKLSARWQIFDEFALRSSISTGFKAPTVGQSNVINVTTAFGVNGLEDQATLPPTNPISVQLGATPLQPEESVNFSLGIAGTIRPEVYLTLDYFRIRLTDRISTTSAIPLTQDDIDVLLEQGVRDASSFSSAKFFTNDFDTTTQGIDFVLHYETQWWQGDTILSLAYNWTDTRVDRVTSYLRQAPDGSQFRETNLTPQRIRMLEDNLPAHRGTISINQAWQNIRALARVSYFGSFYEDHLDASAGLDIYAGSEWLLDAEVSYDVSKAFTLAIGAKNLLDNRPDTNPFQGTVGALYPATSPFGINGGLYYIRALYQY